MNLAEVEARIAQLEARVESLRDMAETQSKQIVALRAQLDHYEARQR